MLFRNRALLATPLLAFALCALAPAAHAAPLKLFYGLLHGHTSEGGDDGEQKYGMTQEDAYDFAKTRARLDFFGVSPHAHMISAPVYEKLIRVANAASSSNFATFHGAEWGNLGVTGHVGTYLTPTMDHTQQPAHSDQYAHMNRYFRWLAKQPRGFGILNHPETFHFGYYYNPMGDRRIVGLEVFNGSAFEKRIDAPDKPMSFETYILPLLNRGWHAGLVGNQDNHFRTWGLATHVRTGAYATAQTTEAIEQAFLARRVFATTDKDLAVWIEAKDEKGTVHPMGARVFGIGHATIRVTAKSGDGEAIQEITLFTDVVDNGALGGAVKKVAGAELSHEAALDLSDRFFVAKIVDASGDIAWTSPIWVSKATGQQVDMNSLVILKRQLEAAKRHLELVGETSDYGKILACAVKYMQSVDRDFSTAVYDWLVKSERLDLRERLRQTAEFLDSLPLQDARLLRKDIKKLAKQLYLTEAEKEFIAAFLKKLDQDDLAPADEASLLKQVDALIKANNFDGAILILDLLIEKFPANAAAYRMKMMAVYSVVEAFETALSLGEQILSNPGLEPTLARDAYLAVALAYKRRSDVSLKPEKIKFLGLSVAQYTQFLKDFPGQPANVLCDVHRFLGDRYESLMRLAADGEKEKYYTAAVKAFNKSKTYTQEPGKVIALAEKVTKVTFSFQGTLDNYRKALDNFLKLIAQYPDEADAKELHKNVADLYLQCAGKVGAAQPAEKDKYLNLAIEWYNKYLTVAPPKDKSEVHYQMGKVLQLLKKYDKAEPFFAAVPKDNWRSTKVEYAIWYRAQCLEKMGRIPDAISHVKTLLEKFPNFDYCIENAKGEQVPDVADTAAAKYLAKLEAGGKSEDDGEMPPMEGVLKSIDARFGYDEDLDQPGAHDEEHVRCDCGGAE